MIERAELRVQRNSTLKAGVIGSLSSGKGGSSARQIAAQLRPAAAAGLGQEAEQLAQARYPQRHG